MGSPQSLPAIHGYSLDHSEAIFLLAIRLCAIQADLGTQKLWGQAQRSVCHHLNIYNEPIH